MKITFDKEYLDELFHTGKCSDKKHRYQPQVVRGYIKAILVLMEAKSVEDLYHFNSLHYEKLVGDKKGIESVRANSQYRIEFTTKEDVGETIVVICNILDLSNHYK
ncbi:MAG: type II toxin-antitoxin system RelE/ParE family toxin [Candidatus Amulumruptor caecigallinarius]|nr:type II toxin-antitoxin system RelE/ParE family toxin [Candidatus Amulumruptor caecigallinarius]MCM1397358.1 type II toxin-antitoxin system RelE/ParE family toxin [Candidatus Amulumruptor caecigallinarius]MCM1453579.1 type II toxin-antitoxin system RelE/ParE family toxin [bacterium]